MGPKTRTVCNLQQHGMENESAIYFYHFQAGRLAMSFSPRTKIPVMPRLLF